MRRPCPTGTVAPKERKIATCKTNTSVSRSLPYLGPFKFTTAQDQFQIKRMDLSRPRIIYSCTRIVYSKFRALGNLFLHLPKQKPFWEANSSSFSEKISRILWNSIFSSFLYPIQSNRINSAPLPHVFVQGPLQNYTSSNLFLRERLHRSLTEPSQQTNICLGMYRQTCVATLIRRVCPDF